MTSGALASLFYRGGLSRGENLYWQIKGSQGDLIFSSAMGNVQVADLRLQGGRAAETSVTEIMPPDDLKASTAALPTGIASNVARLYEQFARDLEDGTHVVSDFGYAVARHGLIDRIRDASRAGGLAPNRYSTVSVRANTWLTD